MKTLAIIVNYKSARWCVPAARSVLASRVLGQLRVVGQFAQSRMVAVIHGWAPAEDVAGFRQALDERFPGLVMVEHLPVHRIERKRIPILLRNHPVLEPFEVLLGLFKPPLYGTVDASAMVGVFFILFYGFILGDVVYGLVVISLAYLLRRRLGHIKTAHATNNQYAK